jgi:AmiR/NasT family two-component response regulator
MDVKIRHIKKIMMLSKLSRKLLRKLNSAQDRLYNGKELNRAQLIFQLTFLMDAPDE